MATSPFSLQVCEPMPEWVSESCECGCVRASNRTRTWSRFILMHYIPRSGQLVHYCSLALFRWRCSQFIPIVAPNDEVTHMFPGVSSLREPQRPERCAQGFLRLTLVRGLEQWYPLVGPKCSDNKLGRWYAYLQESPQSVISNVIRHSSRRLVWRLDARWR